MNLQHAPSWFSLAALLVACGGTVARNEGGPTAGTSSSGGSNGQAGATARAGAPSLGGSFGSAGTQSAGGGPSCEAVDCVTVDCAEDEVEALEPGACCPTCKPKPGGCEEVKCQPVPPCPAGYERAQPPGACCVGCVPKPGAVACNEIACPQTTCPLGYIRGDVLGGCCYDCVPDPLYCRGNEDCVMADKPRACCGCPEAITRRQYDADPCWSDLSSPRPIPQMCFPEVTCDAACAPCINEGNSAVCSENRCAAPGFGLK